MTTQAPDLPRCSYSGAIDADGHILEPPDLWERYLESKYRDRAIRLAKGERGEYLEVNGRRCKLSSGVPRAGVMDRNAGIVYEREPTGLGYVDTASFGAMDFQERLQRLDIENIERCIVYPTLSTIWEPDCEDLELAYAYARAYNRWIVDACADTEGRLVPIAHIPLGVPALAEEELRRAAKDGVAGFFVPPFVWSRKAHGHPDHHALFATAQELGLPMGIHPALEPFWAAPVRFGRMTSGDTAFYQNVISGEPIRAGFTSLFQYGVFDLFPELRVVILEIGAGWIGYWLERMDAVYQAGVSPVPLKELPSEYFKRQCWISADPDERSVAGVITTVGEDRFFWASDFPHPDHPPDYIPALEGLLELLPESAAPRLLGQNVIDCYNLS